MAEPFETVLVTPFVATPFDAGLFTAQITREQDFGVVEAITNDMNAKEFLIDHGQLGNSSDGRPWMSSTHRRGDLWLMKLSWCWNALRGYWEHRGSDPLPAQLFKGLRKDGTERLDLYEPEAYAMSLLLAGKAELEWGNHYREDRSIHALMAEKLGCAPGDVPNTLRWYFKQNPQPYGSKLDIAFPWLAERFYEPVIRELHIDVELVLTGVMRTAICNTCADTGLTPAVITPRSVWASPKFLYVMGEHLKQLSFRFNRWSK